MGSARALRVCLVFVAIGSLGTLIGGCSSALGIGAAGNGKCAQRQGTYRDTYKERTGNCGPITESISTVAAQPTTVAPSCTGSITYSNDNCEVRFNSRCPIKGGTSTDEGLAKWSVDASYGEAVFELTVEVGSSTCRSTYDLVMQRI